MTTTWVLPVVCMLLCATRVRPRSDVPAVCVGSSFELPAVWLCPFAGDSIGEISISSMCSLPGEMTVEVCTTSLGTIGTWAFVTSDAVPGRAGARGGFASLADLLLAADINTFLPMG